MNTIIGMAADHAGYPLKEALKPMLESRGFEIKDFGTFSDTPLQRLWRVEQLPLA